jgi:hypothetical protein
VTTKAAVRRRRYLVSDKRAPAALSVRIANLMVADVQTLILTGGPAKLEADELWSD